MRCTIRKKECGKLPQRNIDDQILLAKIALNDRDMSVRKTAIDKLEDESVLETIANDRSEIVSSRAEERLQALGQNNHK